MGHDQVVGALHEAGEFALAVGAEQVRTGLRDEDVVLAARAGFLDKEEFVSGGGDDGTAVFHPERDFDHGTAAGVDVALVADEIAHAVNEEHVFVKLLAVAHLHGLDHVGMSADDEVHALADEPVGESSLRGDGLELVLDAPVQVHADGMRSAFAGQCDVVGNKLLVNEIDDDITLDGDAVGTVGVIQESDFHALDVDDIRDALFSVLLAGIGADMGDAQRVEDVARAHQALVTTVQAVVVGGEKEVETHLPQLLGIAVGGAEAGIARVGFAAQGALQIDDGQVGAADVLGQILETGAVIVGAVGLLGGSDLRGVLHRIAHKRQFHRVVALEQRHE